MNKTQWNTVEKEYKFLLKRKKKIVKKIFCFELFWKKGWVETGVPGGKPPEGRGTSSSLRVLGRECWCYSWFQRYTEQYNYMMVWVYVPMSCLAAAGVVWMSALALKCQSAGLWDLWRSLGQRTVSGEREGPWAGAHPLFRVFFLLQPGLLCLRSFFFNQASVFGHGPAEDDKLDSLRQLWIQSDSWRCSLFWSWSGFTVEIFGHLKSQHLSISELSFKVLALCEKHELIHRRKIDTSKWSASWALMELTS